MNIVEYGLDGLRSSRFPKKNVDHVDNEAFKEYRRNKSRESARDGSPTLERPSLCSIHKLDRRGAGLSSRSKTNLDV